MNMMFSYTFLIILFAFELTSGVSAQNSPVAANAQSTSTPYKSGVQIIYPKGEHLCGGVLINGLHVLTAASCVESFEEGWDFTQLVLQSADGSQSRRAITFFIHSSYSRDELENNLAVIKLDNPFGEEDEMSSVRILEVNQTSNCLVTKWSRKEKLLTKVSNMTFESVFERPMNTCSINVTKTLCIGSDKNISLCEEDYGGGLFCDGQLAGIFIGPGDTCDGSPGVFADVRLYEDWLNTTAKYDSSKHRKLRNGGYPAMILRLRENTNMLFMYALICFNNVPLLSKYSFF